MTNFKNTKRALISSVLALVMCMTMLLGTTFAWFTDTVTSTCNVIQTGTLDVQLFQHFEDGSVEITNDSDPIFGKGESVNANANTADTLWEPGKTQTVYLSIKNNGSLDLKYTVAIEVTNVTNNLTDVMALVKIIFVSVVNQVNQPCHRNENINAALQCCILFHQ